MSFEEQLVLILMKSNLSNFFFHYLCLSSKTSISSMKNIYHKSLENFTKPKINIYYLLIPHLELLDMLIHYFSPTIFWMSTLYLLLSSYCPFLC